MLTFSLSLQVSLNTTHWWPAVLWLSTISAFTGTCNQTTVWNVSPTYLSQLPSFNTFKFEHILTDTPLIWSGHHPKTTVLLQQKRCCCCLITCGWNVSSTWRNRSFSRKWSYTESIKALTRQRFIMISHRRLWPQCCLLYKQRMTLPIGIMLFWHNLSRSMHHYKCVVSPIVHSYHGMMRSWSMPNRYDDNLNGSGVIYHFKCIAKCTRHSVHR